MHKLINCSLNCLKEGVVIVTCHATGGESMIEATNVGSCPASSSHGVVVSVPFPNTPLRVEMTQLQ